MDTPDDPLTGGVLRSDDDVALRVVDGVIVERAAYAEVRATHPDDDVLDLREGVLLPGLVDTHVHYPQVRAIGALGMPLLEWLDRCALPEEERLADPAYARAVAEEFVFGLVSAGHHHGAGLRLPLRLGRRRPLRRGRAGRPAGDVRARRQRPGPSGVAAHHARPFRRGVARARGALARPGPAAVRRHPALLVLRRRRPARRLRHRAQEVAGSWFTSHVNENLAEVAAVAELFPGRAHYVDTYDAHGLVGPRSVLAHNVHPTDDELRVLGARGAAIANCPTSNAALGSGLFSQRRHDAFGVRVALGSDVGAGTGFSLFKEGLQAYFHQRLLGPDGVPLTSAHLLHLATMAGAEALGLADEIGDLSVGKQFDAVWVKPLADDPLDVCIRHAASPDDALAKIFALGGDTDVAGVWVGGTRVKG